MFDKDQFDYQEYKKLKDLMRKIESEIEIFLKDLKKAERFVLAARRARLCSVKLGKDLHLFRKLSCKMGWK